VKRSAFFQDIEEVRQVRVDNDAFEKLKAYLVSSLVLTPPIKEEEMLLYIAATTMVVSTTIIVEREEEGHI
jgi:hypothetical protein